MRILSLRQPWAFAVTHLGKRIENRKWNTAFRGEFLIHAAKGMTLDEFEDAPLWMTSRGLMPTEPKAKELLRGGIVGIARLDGVLRPKANRLLSDDEAALRANDPQAHEILKWWMPEQYGFVLRDVRTLPFLPCRGALGLFEAPLEIEKAALGALAGVCPCESELEEPGPGHLASCPYSDPSYDGAML